MHARTFLCREALWEAFEEMAREQGAPIDEVLADAMRAYARHRSYGGRTGEEPRRDEPVPSGHDYDAEDAPDLARTGMLRQPSLPSKRAVPPGEATVTRYPGSEVNPRPSPSAIATARGVAPPHSSPPALRGAAPVPDVPHGRPPLQRPFTAPIGHALPPPPARSGAVQYPSTPGMLAPPPHARASVPPPTRSRPPPPSDPRMAAPPQFQNMPGMAARGRAATRLSLTYKNRSVDVTKERFVLGRSKSQADLVLDDANVSRQHAAIERDGDTWFVVDLGSTNGCYVEGQRVSRRPIADGDILEITTHQIRCTLR